MEKCDLRHLQVGEVASSETIVAPRAKILGRGELFIQSIFTHPRFQMMVKLHTWLKMPPPNEDMADLGEVVKVKFLILESYRRPQKSI